MKREESYVNERSEQLREFLNHLVSRTEIKFDDIFNAKSKKSIMEIAKNWKIR